MAEPQTQTLDERFDEVTQAFLDQRDFTTFCHDKLSARLDKMNGRLDQMDGRLDTMDGRLDTMDGRLDTMTGHLSQTDGRLGRIELVLSEVLNEVKTRRSPR